MLEDDPHHPIPSVRSVDVAVGLKHGAYYAIVIAQPLTNDERSRHRLLAKLEAYLNDFYSDEFEKTHGKPKPGKLRIYMKIHPGSDAGIFQLLESCRPWLSDNEVELKVSTPRAVLS